MDNQNPTCQICGSSRTKLAYIQSGYRIVRCCVCGFRFVTPTPSREVLASYYDRSYSVPLERYARVIPTKHGRIERLEYWLPARGRLLEVGASYGHALAQARMRGWQVAGVELSPHASHYAHEHFGIDVWTGDLLDAPLDRGSFDAVMMWHVLEHTQDPRAQLMHIHTLLKPGGVLALAVPNIESLGARLAGRSWPWIAPPAHLWYFSATTLPRLLSQCGYDVMECRTLRGDGNNLYQYLLIAFGSRLNALRYRIRRRAVSPSAAYEHSAVDRPQRAPAALQGVWMKFSAGVQPYTDRLATLTSGLTERIEAAGWGDELICYARRPSV